MRKIIQMMLILALVGCNTVPKRQDDSTFQLNEDKKLLVSQYYIGVDDQVQVNVWKNPDLSISVPVRPDGIISVPLIGEVVAGGRTPVEVADEITKKLSQYIRDPQVSVILVELKSHEFLSRVRVTGAVRNPISINYRQGMQVIDLVLQAGGLNEFASGNRSKLFRKIDGKFETLNIDLFDILNDGDMKTNHNIQPGDIISVPERVF
ncbi:XrtA/PEP-CTERM system exopolysaccharide export protein [Aliikangiella sp. IMCC44359]|uniref:XrtA/PEP-CTERM system exopolysaccharide export protein n=1 Tax=Aliikangiella sp. IMCC44359 TaxID=3459125 RepID=UPI00403A8B5B